MKKSAKKAVKKGAKRPAVVRREPRQGRSRETVDIILAAAAQVAESLGDEGFGRFTAELVAKRAGVSIGTVYQYFSNKQQILAELLDGINRKDLALVQEAFKEKAGTLAEKVEHAMDRVIKERFVGHRDLYRFVVVNRERIVRPSSNRAIQESIVSRMQELLEPHRHELGQHSSYHVAFLITRFFMNAAGSATVLRPELLTDEAFVSLFKTWVASIPQMKKAQP